MEGRLVDDSRVVAAGGREFRTVPFDATEDDTWVKEATLTLDESSSWDIARACRRTFTSSEHFLLTRTNEGTERGQYGVLLIANRTPSP